VGTRRLLLWTVGVACWIVVAVLNGGLAAGQKEIAVTAEELAKDYASGPATFNKKYEGKVVVVRGIIEDPEVEAVLTKERYLMLVGYQKKGDPVGVGVRCKHVPELKGLKKGQEVTIQGKCLGHKETILAAGLVECKLVKKAAKK